MVEDSFIEKLTQHNKPNYNLHKASEEFQELGLVLNQKLLKPNKVDDQEIIDEIGDCIIRLEVLKKIYPLDLIQKRVDYKVNKFKEYMEIYGGV